MSDDQFTADEATREMREFVVAGMPPSEVTPGPLYIVGESGPEIFTPSGPGQIIPNPREPGEGDDEPD